MATSSTVAAIAADTLMASKQKKQRSSSSSSRSRARVCDMSSLPSVLMSNILSFLPLIIGHHDSSGSSGDDDDAAVSHDLMVVSRDWFTYVRNIKRPCIEWIRPKESVVGLLLRKYPNAINAASLVNFPLYAIQSLVAMNHHPSHRYDH